jgi:hypothetical protein
MIDIATEKLLAVEDIPHYVPCSLKTGRRISDVTAWRWITRGISGVRLDALRLGKRWFTSQEALGRFGAELAACSRSDTPSSGAADSTSKSNTVANLAHDRAMAELAAQGLV